ncbi:R2-like ligand-binding oxidase [Rhodohalobacter sp. SW132]|uniref:R2-like ligand-binding oxidase n=1 Tax=Rhodohalobacter sp. SW132 TaxID=2293433 RepID=UPI000E23C8F8|nr:R2-like ligand-binding oxidase [Rhodohalobacter sp. SW132]REL39117.1 R2-like ligand-binding oxidase [Rhodohalobacter sp. SW132]
MWFNKKETKSDTDYFSTQWMESWKESINQSEHYKKTAATWNAPLILKIEPRPESFDDDSAIGLYMNLAYGECLEMRYAHENDTDTTDIILKADRDTWVKMIENSKDPTMAIMKGDISIEKGSLITLSTQRKAASALLKTAPSIYKGVPVPSENISPKKEAPDPTHKTFVTTSRGLNHESFPMKLFQKSKQFGIWNPSDINLDEDRKQWQTFSPEEKQIITHLSALFMAGEEAVTLDLLPLIQVIAKEGRIEEEIYLTSFLWEEAKHTEFFSRYVQTVMTGTPDFEQFHKPMYKILFYEKLPKALHALSSDSSPSAQLHAAGTYNMIVEGTLAETGYEAFSKMLTENQLLPGMQEGILKLKQDESRHVAYGIYLINRLLDENRGLADGFEETLEELLYDATNIIMEIFAQYEIVPFGLKQDWFLDHAVKQFQHRIRKLNL